MLPWPTTTDKTRQAPGCNWRCPLSRKPLGTVGTKRKEAIDINCLLQIFHSLLLISSLRARPLPLRPFEDSAFEVHVANRLASSALRFLLESARKLWHIFASTYLTIADMESWPKIPPKCRVLLHCPVSFYSFRLFLCCLLRDLAQALLSQASMAFNFFKTFPPRVLFLNRCFAPEVCFTPSIFLVLAAWSVLPNQFRNHVPLSLPCCKFLQSVMLATA